MGKPGPKRIEHKIINGLEYKYCRKCSLWIPVTEFSTATGKWDRLYPNCKKCVREYRENNKEHIKAHKHLYHINNRKHDNEKSRQWHENHPNYTSEKSRQWHKNHPDVKYFLNVRRKYGISREEWVKLYESLDRKCGICKNPFKDTLDCHTDHNHTTGQIRQLLCSQCNKLIGYVHEDTSILASMINYLKSGTYDYTYYSGIAATANGKLITRNICISQEWACAVCGKSLLDTRVCLDHDNKLIENNIRGCLCLQDNLALGYCHDDVNIIRSAIAYLNHWELQYYLDEAIQNKNISLTH